MENNVVYLHVKKGTNDVFYVGIGSNKRRAYSTASRNKHWRSVVDKYGYEVRLVNTGLTREEAILTEKELIFAFGRRDLGLGQLVNQTDGGDGNVGFSTESRAKISKAHKGRKYSDQINKSKGRKGGNKGSFKKGQPSPRRKRVEYKDIKYPSITSLMTDTKYSTKKVYKKISNGEIKYI